MKQFIRLSVLVIILFAAATSCKENNNAEPVLTGTDEEYKAVLVSFVEHTIKPTYKALAEAALVMRAANEALKSNPNNASMKGASDAWMDARIKWEISEAFLFGPVGEQALDIDGHIDSWPLELEDIKREIAKGTITGREAWQKEGEVIGFHVTEYLLYRDGKTRPVTDLTANQFSYLIAVTDALVWDCILAYVAWVGINTVPTEMRDVFYENSDIAAHLENNPTYKDFASRLTNAIGYPSIAAAMSEIASGAAQIAGEVGAVKIAEPYDEQNTNKVESWYSWHSLDDYTNNILSIKNAYLGGIDDKSRPEVSLSTYIASKDRSLDKEIKEKIEDCIDKIKAIGNNGQYSFYEVVDKQINGVQVEAAEEACDELRKVFEYVRDEIQ
jgi:uncharacterized iron-regulated protein